MTRRRSPIVMKRYNDCQRCGARPEVSYMEDVDCYIVNCGCGAMTTHCDEVLMRYNWNDFEDVLDTNHPAFSEDGGWLDYDIDDALIKATEAA